MLTKDLNIFSFTFLHNLQVNRGGQLTLQTEKNASEGFENIRVYRLQIVPVPARLTGKNSLFDMFERSGRYRGIEDFVLHIYKRCSENSIFKTSSLKKIINHAIVYRSVVEYLS